ncbi:hypothetical protein SUGI_0977410 [Cryptomeria japonica]|nr:hypothetical protein SUGI_0977410 [Cryptomeria japonica]
MVVVSHERFKKPLSFIQWSDDCGRAHQRKEVKRGWEALKLVVKIKELDDAVRQPKREVGIVEGRVLQSRKRKRFRGTGIGRRLLFGGAAFLLGGFLMAGERSSFSAIARIKKSEIEEVLKNVDWPEQFPFKKEGFERSDESPDQTFYSTPRFVTHIDDPAINAITQFYASVFPASDTAGVTLLDMCSSWVSHYPKGYKQERIVGMGMNEDELKRNPVLTEYLVQDLNVDPRLPFEDNTFDVITNVVSVDYLKKPLDVFKEMRRILKPGGLAVMSFSNRCFWTKAISIWTSTGDADHVWIVGSYFHYAGGFEPPQVTSINF